MRLRSGRVTLLEAQFQRPNCLPRQTGGPVDSPQISSLVFFLKFDNQSTFVRPVAYLGFC